MPDVQAETAGLYLKAILNNKGGMLKDHTQSPILRVYTGVTFGSFNIGLHTGISLELHCDAPPGRARQGSMNSRAGYWKESQLLSNGALVVLLWKTPDKVVHVHFGTICSREITPVHGSDRVSLSVTFKEDEIMQKVLAFTSSKARQHSGLCLLLEAPAMFAAYEPFLRRLQTVAPARLPFEETIGGSSMTSFTPPSAQAPAYSSMPGFRMKIKPGAQASKSGNAAMDELLLVTTESGSQAQIQEELVDSTTFDASQARGVVHCLSRDIALLQGPPGTGKSFVGIQLVKALIDSGATPVGLMQLGTSKLTIADPAGRQD